MPIWVPINLTNVQTAGYMANIKARYVQAQRHYQGVSDVAYSMRYTLDAVSDAVDIKGMRARQMFLALRRYRLTRVSSDVRRLFRRLWKGVRHPYGLQDGALTPVSVMDDVLDEEEGDCVVTSMSSSSAPLSADAR